MEEWRDIKGYEGVYQVSNIGRVKSLPRIVFYKDGRIRHNKERVFSLTYKDGYTEVRLHKDHDRKGRLYKVHVLVAQAFIPNKENKPYIDHINTIRDDNRVENLNWVTHKENMNNPISRKKTRESSLIRFQRHGEREKLSVAKRRYFSNPENHKKFIEKMNEPAIKEKIRSGKIKAVCHYNSLLRLIGEYPSANDAARIEGISQKQVSEYCLGKSMPRDRSLWFYLEDYSHDNVNKRLKQIESAYSKRHVMQYSKDGDFISDYSSIRKASHTTGISETAISNAIAGRANSSGGYIWKTTG